MSVVSNITGKMYSNLFRKISVRAFSKVSKDKFHQYDAPAEEVRLVQERLRIRKALRQEYLRKATDPHSTDPIIFDPLMQRYYSMHMTVTDRFIPTFKNWCVYMATTILPVVFFALLFKWRREDKERKYRSGEIEYKDRFFRDL